MIRNMFKKTDTQIDAKYTAPGRGFRRKDLPRGLWKKCNKCRQPVYVEDVVEDCYICPRCGGYFRMPARQRIEMLVEDGSFEEWNREMDPVDPLDFPGYGRQLCAAREKTALNEAIIIGRGRIEGQDAVIGVCDARFLMSSMGRVVGEKITQAVECATREHLPVILFATSGGARMQEGIVSLMQMAKTAAALRRHHEAGGLYISVLTDPTMGGVTASFAMLGDIILAEPGALVGFAGPRVIEQTIGQRLPEGFQRAEFLLEHGFVDRVVERRDLKRVIGQILRMHRRNTGFFASGVQAMQKALVDGVQREGRAEESAKQDPSGGPAPEMVSGRQQGKGKVLEQKGRRLLQQEDGDAWTAVLLSRRTDRPTAEDYIVGLFEDFLELHGDRCFGDDGAIMGGIASFHGMPVTVIGQVKGKSTKENKRRNFGMPSPEGYRKALRLMKQAETFGRPVICFVDTPGAFCGPQAEERGQGEAIARNLFEMSALKVPILSVVIGEGGSGGALAMAVANEVWMLENSTYAILSPEGFASILWKDGKKASDAARVMKLTAPELYRLGMIERVIPEPERLNQETLPVVLSGLNRAIEDFLEGLEGTDGKALAESRYDRFRAM